MSANIGCDIGYGGGKKAIFKAGHFEVMPSESGGKSCPSYVFLAKDGKIFIGEDARQMGIVSPERVAHGWKEFLADPTKKYFEGTASAFDVHVMFLKALREQAEKHLGISVDGAVFTCPTSFDDAAKFAMGEAAKKAGFRVLQIVGESEAAALANVQKNLPDPSRPYRILCIDFGHGTLDVSVVEVFGGVAKAIASEGVARLGGRDITAALEKVVLDKISKATGKSITIDKLAAEQAEELHEKVEQLKHRLGGTGSAKISQNFGGRSQVIEVSSADALAACVSIHQKTKDCIDRAMKASGKTYKDIDKLVVAGSPFLDKKLQSLVTDHTGLAIYDLVDPGSAVSFGAALLAHQVELKEGGKKGPLGAISLKSTTTHDVGVCMIDKSSGSRKEVCWRMVPKGTEVPCELTDVFRLESPSQTTLNVSILQGSHGASAKDCLCIGEMHLTGLPPESVLTSRIKLLFKFDSDTIVTVTATDTLSGISQTVSVKLGTGKKAA